MMGLLDLPDSATYRTGESPFFISEQFAFKKRLGDSHAVDHLKWVVRPGTVLVDGPGHQFFACTGLAADKNRGIGRGCPSDGLIEILHDLTSSDNGFCRSPIGNYVHFHF